MALLLFHCTPLGPPHLWPYLCSFVAYGPPYFLISCKSHLLFSCSVVLLFSRSIVAHIITVVLKPIYSLEWTQRCSSTLRPQSVIVGEYASLAFVLVPRKAQQAELLIVQYLWWSSRRKTTHWAFLLLHRPWPLACFLTWLSACWYKCAWSTHTLISLPHYITFYAFHWKKSRVRITSHKPRLHEAFNPDPYPD